MGLVSSGVWERTGVDKLEEVVYIRTVAFTTLVMACIVGIGSAISYNWEATWLLILGPFAAAIICIFVYEFVDDPFISFVAVAGMSIALGIMIGPLVALYNSTIIIEAIVTTCGIMAAMSFAGLMYPRVFEGMGPFLFGGLLVLIGGGIVNLILFQSDAGDGWLSYVLDWGGIAVFTLLVAYDWTRAMKLPRTFNNAIDSSGALILDAVNLFIRLLEIYSRAQGGSSSRSGR